MLLMIQWRGYERSPGSLFREVVAAAGVPFPSCSNDDEGVVITDVVGHRKEQESIIDLDLQGGRDTKIHQVENENEMKRVKEEGCGVG